MLEIKIMSSILQQFTQAAQAIAASVIGTEPLIISSGQPIQGIFNVGRFNRDYETGGFNTNATLEFVISSVDFHAKYPLTLKEYEGKKASARGESWRIGSIEGGKNEIGQFITIHLTSENKAA